MPLSTADTPARPVYLCRTAGLAGIPRTGALSKLTAARVSRCVHAQAAMGRQMDAGCVRQHDLGSNIELCISEKAWLIFSKLYSCTSRSRGFIPKYLTFPIFCQIYQYTSCLLSKFRFHTNIPHFGGPVYQYTSSFLKIPAIYQYTACMIWARKKGIPIYLMFSENGQIYQYTSI